MMKFKISPLIFLILTVGLLTAGSLGLSLYQKIELEKVSLASVQITIPEDILKQKVKNSAPQVSISNQTLEQGDTLLVKISPVDSGQINGNLGPKEINFFQSQENQVIGIIGISPKQNPGQYDLKINLPSGNQFEKEIAVEERNFPTEEFPTTEKLREKGYSYQKILSESRKEKIILDQIFETFTPKAYIKGPSSFPLKEIKVTDGFWVMRKNENFRVRHAGIDLKAKVGTPVYAIYGGKVEMAQNSKIRGKVIVINHGYGIFSLYAHLSQFKVSEGQEINKGEVIALSGASGYATGPHLHLTIKINSKVVDPLKFIRTLKKLESSIKTVHGS